MKSSNWNMRSSLNIGFCLLTFVFLFNSRLIKFNKNFYVFTGSSVGVVPILGKGFYRGLIQKLGSVSVKIN